MPVCDSQLTQQAVSRLPALPELWGQLAGLHHPRQEQLQGGHVLWKRGRGLTAHTNSTVGTNLKKTQHLACSLWHSGPIQSVHLAENGPNVIQPQHSLPVDHRVSDVVDITKDTKHAQPHCCSHFRTPPPRRTPTLASGRGQRCRGRGEMPGRGTLICTKTANRILSNTKPSNPKEWLALGTL